MKFFQIFLISFCVTACDSQHGCAPKFANLKTQYPHVLYKGPKEPSEVIIKKYPPPDWTFLSDVSKKAQGAILVSEDWAFFDHHGYDGKQIQDAIHDSLTAGKLKRGASTITQQVVKNVYLSQEKSLVRKLREIWMATKVEKVVGKNKIFEIYLNIAEFGEGLFGIGAASRHYFNKSPKELSAREGAFLAMLLPSPKKYSISFQKRQLTPYARRTIRSVLNKMVVAHYLTPEQRDDEWKTPLSFETTSDFTIPSDGSQEPGDTDEESIDLPENTPENPIENTSEGPSESPPENPSPSPEMESSPVSIPD